MAGKKEVYDLIIVGAGPAAWGCAVYSTRYRLKTLILGKEIGGLVSETPLIENYMGFKAISGTDLTKKCREQVESFGGIVKQELVKKIKKNKNLFTVYGEGKNVYKGKTILLGLGMKRRLLNIPEEEKFKGKGISYCSSCDMPIFKNLVVGVVGGADAAATTALFGTDYAKKVYIIYRKGKLRAKPYLRKKVEGNKKIEIIYNANVKHAFGKNLLEGVELDTGKKLKLDGLFIEIGSVPATQLAFDLGVKLDKMKRINVNTKQETNVKGVYAAGDVTTGSDGFRQIICAGSEGAVAAKNIYNYLLGV